MKIFRVEHEGLGFYRTNISDQIGWYGNTSHDHPHPFDDVFGFEDLTSDEMKQYFFGFESMLQLSMWFPKEIQEKFEEYKVDILCYEIPEQYVLFGRKQVAFLKHKATLSKECVNDDVYSFSG